MPSKGDINPATGKAYAVNPATGVWDDNYWANTVEPQLKAQAGVQTGFSPQQSADQLLLNSYKALAEERNKRFKDYEKAKGPFSLDEVLIAKRLEAKEQIDPYYDETLSNYLLGVERKRQRSSADTQDLLGELSATEASFTGATKLKLDEAINRAREGFADVGLFESGQRFRAEGLAQREAGEEMGEFGRRTALRRKGLETGLGRTLEDVGLESTMRQRDIGRERFTETETLASRLAKEKGQRYVTEFGQTLPPELQANQNFDLLKQIGIYG